MCLKNANPTQLHSAVNKSMPTWCSISVKIYPSFELIYGLQKATFIQPNHPAIIGQSNSRMVIRLNIHIFQRSFSLNPANYPASYPLGYNDTFKCFIRIRPGVATNMVNNASNPPFLFKPFSKFGGG